MANDHIFASIFVLLGHGKRRCKDCKDNVCPGPEYPLVLFQPTLCCLLFAHRTSLPLSSPSQRSPCKMQQLSPLIRCHRLQPLNSSRYPIATPTAPLPMLDIPPASDPLLQFMANTIMRHGKLKCESSRVCSCGYIPPHAHRPSTLPSFSPPLPHAACRTPRPCRAQREAAHAVCRQMDPQSERESSWADP